MAGEEFEESVVNEGNASVAKKKTKVSRRAVLKGAAATGLGLVAAAAAAGVVSDDRVLKSSGDVQTREAAVDGTADESAVRGACKIVPGDEVAQSLLVALCPERLACRVARLSQYEVEKSSSLRNLPKLENFSCYLSGDSDFDRMREADNEILKDADLIVYADVMGLGACQKAKDVFYSETGIPYVSLTAEIGGLASLFRKLAAAVGVKPSEAPLDCLTAVDELQLHAAEVDSQSRFSVSVFAGKDGDRLCRNDVSLGAIRLGAGVKPSNLVVNSGGLFNGADADDVVVDNIEQDFDINFILLAHQKAFGAYLGKLGVGPVPGGYSMWRSTPVSAVGDVLPALVSKRAWLESMSPFAQLSLGAVWLANYLYPDACDYNIDELVTDFYSGLFGMSLPQAKYAADAERTLELKRGMTSEEVRSEREAHEEEMGKRFAEWWQQVDEANTRPITSEEQAMIDKWVEEGLEQQRQEQRRNRKYLEAIKGEQ